MKHEMKMEQILPLITLGFENSGEFVFYPKGISMLPTIKPLHDKVKLTKPEKIKKYSVVLYRRDNGKFILHRVIKLEKNCKYTTSGDNQFCLERGVNKQQIIAVVSEIIHENEKITYCYGFNNTVYAFFLRSYRFSQRCVCAIKRRLTFLSNNK